MKWSEENNDAREAFHLYLKTEKYAEAVTLLEAHPWPEATLKVANGLSPDEESLLGRCAAVSTRNGRLEEAECILQRISNKRALVQVLYTKV